jgi:hypothetical protein
MFDKNIIHSGNYCANAVALFGAGINVANRILLIVLPGRAHPACERDCSDAAPPGVSGGGRIQVTRSAAFQSSSSIERYVRDVPG